LNERKIWNKKVANTKFWKQNLREKFNIQKLEHAKEKTHVIPSPLLRRVPTRRPPAAAPPGAERMRLAGLQAPHAAEADQAAAPLLRQCGGLWRHLQMR
jgi:hypothetical protein